MIPKGDQSMRRLTASIQTASVLILLLTAAIGYWMVGPLSAQTCDDWDYCHDIMGGSWDEPCSTYYCDSTEQFCCIAPIEVVVDR